MQNSHTNEDPATYSIKTDLKKIDLKRMNLFNYQPSGEGGTRSPPAKSKMAARGPKMADGVWKGVYP